MNTLQKTLLTLAITLTVFAGFTFSQGGDVFGSDGNATNIATSTYAYPVGTSQIVLFATSTCSSRIVTTRDIAVSLSFNEAAGRVPTAIAGHVQTASTTVVYDSEQYGCGAVRAVSTGAATTVHVSEAR